MAITLQCPRCTHEQKIDDDRIGKDVPCKICHHLIKTGSGGEKPKANLASAEKDQQQEGVKAGSPSAPTGKKSTKTSNDEPAKPSKKRNDREDDADSKRPMPRTRRADEGASSGALAMVLIGGGVFALLVLLCGGGGIGAYFIFRSGGRVEEKIAQNDKPIPQDQVPQGQDALPPKDDKPDFGPRPGPEQGPGPDAFPPFKDNNPFQQPPQQENLDPNNPDHIGRVLDQLKGPGQQRGPALTWLNQANPTHPRRGEVAQVLSGQVDEQLKLPLGNDSFFNPYFRWATKDCVPSLIRLVDNPSIAVWHNRYRHEAMKLLGKFKDVRGAEPIAKKLNSFFDGQAPTEALIEMGPIAESAVLKYFNDPDGGKRDAARRILQTYQTRNEVLLAQSIADLEAADVKHRGGALQWLAKSQVDGKRKSEVSKALNKCLDHPDCLRNGDLVVALENWGTAENVAKLSQVLDQSRFGNGAAIRILGKVADADSIKAVARSLANPFNHGEAKKVLKDAGPTAEQAVLDVLSATNDNRTRQECVRVLGDIGTRKVSGIALQQLAQRSPQDRFLMLIVQQAQTSINARGK